jgi:hypothetical protein
MATIEAPGDFKKSYGLFETYPRNLVHKTAFPPALKVYAARLDSFSPTMFKRDDANVNVSFRDLDTNGQGRFLAGCHDFLLTAKAFVGQNVFGDDKLKSWLGDQSKLDSSTSRVEGEVATRRDPKCRFM